MSVFQNDFHIGVQADGDIFGWYTLHIQQLDVRAQDHPRCSAGAAFQGVALASPTVNCDVHAEVEVEADSSYNFISTVDISILQQMAEFDTQYKYHSSLHGCSLNSS